MQRAVCIAPLLLTVQERHARGVAYREIRALNGSSKRAAKDARQVWHLQRCESCLDCQLGQVPWWLNCRLVKFVGASWSQAMFSMRVTRGPQAAKKEARKSTGTTCEHGIWR